MPLRNLEAVDGEKAGAWILPRFEGGFGGRVEYLVPNDYDGYVRVFHPPYNADGNVTTWAQVAAGLGRTAHREMQWHKVGGDLWKGREPWAGEMDEVVLNALCNVLEAHTDDPRHCFFGLTTIYGGVEEAYPRVRLLRWPGRDFVVFAGPLSAADQLGYVDDGKSSRRFTVNLSTGEMEPVEPVPSWLSHAPNLIWPADRSWFVQSEYDLDSTVIGGDRALIDAILSAPDLETWAVERGDSLEIDADKIN